MSPMSSMPFWIAVHLPRLPLDALQPAWPGAQARALPGLLEQAAPVAVLEQERVVLANAAAMALGVRYGMRRGGVQALSAEVVQLEREPAAEAELMAAAALALLRFTPQVACDDEGATLMLDVSASLRLFGGHRALCRAVRACVRRLGAVPQLGCGSSARGAAWLAAQPLRRGRHGAVVRPPRRALRPARMARLLDRLPVEALYRLADPAWLDGIGCRTVGEVRALPRAALKRRVGPGLLEGLDQAYGEAPDSLPWFVAPPVFARRMDLPGRIEGAEGVLAGAQRLLLAMAGWLAGQQAGATRFVLVLEHERYRAGEAPQGTPVEVALAQPSRDPEHLSKLLQERLGQLRFGAPVVGLGLKVEAMQESLPRSASLFPEPGAEAAALGRVLDTLVARLGRDGVLQPRPLADHRPERASRWCALDEDAPGPALPAGIPLPERPLWLLAEPVPLAARQERPCHGGPMRLLTRPERIESGWWDGALASRDYYIAERSDGVRCWVYCVYLGHGADVTAHWYLHGLFA